MSIKEIAEKVGVSVSTVSRVLSNPDYKCSSQELHDKILETAKALRYVPNETARSLRSGKVPESRSFHIGVLVTDKNEKTDPFVTEMLECVTRQAESAQCVLTQTVSCPHFSEERTLSDVEIAQKIEKMRGDANPDGLILIGDCSLKALTQLRKLSKNIMLLSRSGQCQGADEVYSDGKKAAEIALEYLIRLGHQSIAYVGPCRGESRFQGFLAALEQQGIEAEYEHIIQCGVSERDGFAAMKQLGEQESRATAIFFARDILALGAMQALSTYKWRGYHPSVISADDITRARYAKPSLTSVNPQKEEMAKLALLLLLDRIQGGHKAAVKLEVESGLVIRGSCAPMEDWDCEYYI